jgi:transketolase
MDNFAKYKEIAREARKTVLRLIYKAQTSHVGSNFSCLDILTILFEKADLDKDKIILSKGWAAASLYYFLWRKGKITKEELDSYCQQITCPKCNGSGFEDGK